MIYNIPIQLVLSFHVNQYSEIDRTAQAPQRLDTDCQAIRISFAKLQRPVLLLFCVFVICVTHISENVKTEEKEKKKINNF